MAYTMRTHGIGAFTPKHKTYPARKGFYVMSNNIVSQPTGNGQQSLKAEQLPSAFCPANQTQPNKEIELINTLCFLQSKINFYSSEVERLERELRKARTLLKGHQTWLQDTLRKAVNEVQR